MNFLSYSSSDSESDGDDDVVAVKKVAVEAPAPCDKVTRPHSPVTLTTATTISRATAIPPSPQQQPVIYDPSDAIPGLRPIPIEGFTFRMPLEPSRTDCDPQLQAKVEKWTHLRKTSGRRFNDTLAKTHSFGNPAIMSKLIEFLGLVEYGSNLEHSNDQPNAEFPKGMYYDEIAKAQKIAAERPPFSVNTNSVTGQTSIVGGIVFAPPSAAQEASSIGITGKRSRWDQGGVNEPAKKK